MTSLAIDLAVALALVAMFATCALVEALLHIFTPCVSAECAACSGARRAR